MITNEEMVDQLRHEIRGQEVKAKEAVNKGVVFQEVKRIKQYIKLLKSRPEYRTIVKPNG